MSRVSFIGHPALLLLQSQIDLQSDFICFDRKSNGCPNLKLKLNVYLKKDYIDTTKRQMTTSKITFYHIMKKTLLEDTVTKIVLD